MLFNSFHFLFVYFPLVTGLYFMTPERQRWILLLLASCYFYMAFIPAYVLILFAVILLDYGAGLLIEGARGRRRKALLILSLLANLGFLGVFKYYNFFNANLVDLCTSLGLDYRGYRLDIVLPIGLSFHTFQSMAYTIEVYRGRFQAERHLGIYALYVLFFPQLVAGPIERPESLLVQLRKSFGPDAARIASGLKLMVWGLFKKVVIADRLSLYVNPVYGDPTAFLGAPLMIATVFFAFQIYCDFSGYSDIAIGVARILGYHLRLNFNRPYLAASMTEFWRRWHISLSTWFRDYVYIPLGGNRSAPWRWYVNLAITFLLSGLWHGANWTFVVWGLVHGLYLMVSVLRTRIWPGYRIPHLLGVLGTFVLACLAWVFFRARTLGDATYVLANMLPLGPLGLEDLALGRTADFFLSCQLIAVLLLVHGAEERTGKNVVELVGERGAGERWLTYLVVLLAVVFLGRFSDAEFIYFQF